MSPRAVYTLLIGCIIPRPVAWASPVGAARYGPAWMAMLDSERQPN